MTGSASLAECGVDDVRAEGERKVVTVQPTARTCLRWAVGLLVAGALLLVYGTQVYVAAAGLAGANAEVDLGLVNIVLTLVRSTTFPVAAALIGAAVVIQALAPRAAGAPPRGDGGA